MDTSLFVHQQVPEFVRESYPKFVEFLKAYYQFLDQYQVSLEDARDSDWLLDDGDLANELLRFIKREFVPHFPNAAVDDRKLQANVKKLYRLKGTFSAIELLFRLFYGQAITIRQPSDNILRASDGRWENESSLVIERKYGSFDEDAQLVLKIENESGLFWIDVTRVVQIDEITTKFYYKNTNQIIIDDDQVIDMVDSTGLLTYRGVIQPSPSYLNIIDGGKYWKVGQIIYINGSIKDTIAQVTSITGTGAISTIKIFEHGYEHNPNELIIVSPFPNKPVSATYDLVSTQTGYNPTTETYIYSHVLTLTDYVDQVDESLLGVKEDNTGALGYFAEEYHDNSEAPGYNGITVMSTSISTGSTTVQQIVNTELTIEEYIESKATLEYVFENTVNHRGRFLSDHGQVSNDNIRLQDNFFYQMFSYAIETELRSEDYAGAVGLIHPAGLKAFYVLLNTTVLERRDITATRTLSSGVLYQSDAYATADVVEDIIHTITKELTDEQSVTDSLNTLVRKVPETEYVTISEDSGTWTIDEVFYNDEEYFSEYYAQTDVTITT